MDDVIVGIGIIAGNPPAELPASREECRAKLDTLRDEMAAIKADIAAADLERQARRGRTDPRWHEQRKAALRDRLRQSADIAAHMATLPRRREALKDNLIEVLRADYDDDGWRRVTEEARRRLDAREAV
ncbi:MAG: hypothetical protein H7840_12560 [Alphaproteobacteria bacterium]